MIKIVPLPQDPAEVLEEPVAAGAAVDILPHEQLNASWQCGASMGPCEGGAHGDAPAMAKF